jgi:NADPH:quinone reductase-like Zn-dependent oxidoreductase
VLYGVTGGAEIPFDARTFYGTGGASIYGFILFHELHAKPTGQGLQRLARLLDQGVLKTPIHAEGKLAEIGELAQQLEDRKFTGKAVIRFT